MGAGNVKAVRSATPMRLPVEPNPASRKSKVAAPVHNIGSEIGAGGAPAKKWDITCDIHRSLICRFCGGQSCKHEDYTRQKDTPAIVGLHSTWVSAVVVGMQRPSTRLIQQHRIVDQFRKAGIGAIINLQLAGEHPHCADGIDAAGFSYRPEEFTDHSIFYYSPGWVDMDTPSLEKMVEIVQIMSFHTERSQKIAVHCHAGYGRTGIVIACFFVYAYGLAAEVAIKSVRDRRPGSVQTRKQQAFVKTFHDYIAFLRGVFVTHSVTPYGERALAAHRGLPLPNAAGLGLDDLAAPMHAEDDEDSSEGSSDGTSDFGGIEGRVAAGAGHTGAVAAYPGLLFTRKHAALIAAIIAERAAFHETRYTLHEALSRQRAILHGAERGALKFVPKVISVLCERLTDLATHNPKLAARAFMDGFKKGPTPPGAKVGSSASLGALTREFDAEREREKERRKARDRARREALGLGIASLNSNRAPSEGQALAPPGLEADPSSAAWREASRASKTVASGAHGGAAPNASVTSSGPDRDEGPKWTAVQDDTLSELKRRVNAADWAPLYACDIRYCAQMLLQWLDELKEPLLPLFERSGSTSSSGEMSSSAHQLLGNPSSLFASLPRWTLATLGQIMRVLVPLRTGAGGLEASVVARLHARFAFALTHPRALLPAALSVVSSPFARVQVALQARCSRATLTGQTMHQAAQAQMVHAQQVLASGASGRSGALAVLRAPPHNFDAVHSVLPAPRGLLDALADFLIEFAATWPEQHAKAQAEEERAAHSTRIGVRKPPSVAHLAVGDGASLAQLQRGDSSKLVALVTPNADGPPLVRTPTGATRFLAPEQTQQEHSVLGLHSRAEVSQTAYLHSRIHHAQPLDAEQDNARVRERRKLESAMLGETNPLALPLASPPRVGSADLDDGVDAQERLTGFLTSRRARKDETTIEDDAKEDDVDPEAGIDGDGDGDDDLAEMDPTEVRRLHKHHLSMSASVYMSPSVAPAEPVATPAPLPPTESPVQRRIVILRNNPAAEVVPALSLAV